MNPDKMITAKGVPLGYVEARRALARLRWSRQGVRLGSDQQVNAVPSLVPYDELAGEHPATLGGMTRRTSLIALLDALAGTAPVGPETRCCFAFYGSVPAGECDRPTDLHVPLARRSAVRRRVSEN
ncbi:hypothetical protein GCM10010123_04770 [Pilimelia anulata]|uniref:Uncharacterized protein n=1 Tax=Pilimelia anulata TaxID=53371 RepID=A0A8J3B6W2_9ACTN|nr:hypothetical protein [Pilimelia anulata]GGJ77758.1 hypothetical protein GCM10010123_04770 [Pilimelia anulata]